MRGDWMSIKSMTEIFYPCKRNNVGLDKEVSISSEVSWRIFDNPGAGQSHLTIKHTNNGGKEWITVCENFSLPRTTGVTFLTNLDGWATCDWSGEYFLYYTSNDSGKTWNKYSLKATVSKPVTQEYTLNAVTFFSKIDGLIVAPNDCTVFATKNSGKTWDNYEGKGTNGSLEWNFQKINGNNVEGCVKYLGCKWITKDGGYSWEKK